MNITFKDSKSMDENDTIDEMLDIQKLVGGDGYVLYKYYRSKHQRWRWTDTVIARKLGWSVDKLKRIRTKLVHNGIFYSFKDKGNTYTYVGGYNALKGKLDKYIEHGYSVSEAIGHVKHEIDIGEVTVYGNAPIYFDHYINIVS
jgi:hypothetical protein